MNHTELQRTKAYEFLNSKREIRPYNEAGEKDASWHYIHRMDARRAIDIALESPPTRFHCQIISLNASEERQCFTLWCTDYSDAMQVVTLGLEDPSMIAVIINQHDGGLFSPLTKQALVLKRV